MAEVLNQNNFSNTLNFIFNKYILNAVL